MKNVLLELVQLRIWQNSLIITFFIIIIKVVMHKAYIIIGT